MKITFKRGDMTQFIILSSIGDDYQKIDDMKPLIINDDDWTMDIELKVNGVSLDFNRFINRLNENYEAAVQSTAKEMVDEKFGDAFELLQDFQKTITDKIDHNE